MKLMNARYKICVVFSLVFMVACTNTSIAKASEANATSCTPLDIKQINMKPAEMLAGDSYAHLSEVIAAQGCSSPNTTLSRVTDLLILDSFLSSLPVLGVRSSGSINEQTVFNLRSKIWKQIPERYLEQSNYLKLTDEDAAKITFLNCQRVSILRWESCESELYPIFLQSAANSSDESRARMFEMLYNEQKFHWQHVKPLNKRKAKKNKKR